MVFPWTLAVATQEGPNGHERCRASAELCSRYIARKRVEDRLSYDELYVASLSPKTIVYKAWVRTRAQGSCRLGRLRLCFPKFCQYTLWL